MSIADEIFAAGISAYVAKDYAKAEQSFRKVLEYEPYSSEAMLNLGNTFYQMGKYQDAEDIWLKTINTNPMEEKAYLNLGNLYYHNKNNAKAVYYWEIFKRLNPIHDNINLNLGLAYEGLGQLVKAYKHYTLHLHSHAGPEGVILKQRMEEAQKIAEHNVQAGEKLMQLGKLQKARDAFAASVTLVPLHPKAYKHYATVLYQLGDLQEAIKWYEFAYEEMEHDVSVLVNLGVAYEKQGDSTQALWAYLTALRINPKKVPPGLDGRCKQMWDKYGQGMLDDGAKRVNDLIQHREYEAAEILASRLWDVAFIFDKDKQPEIKKLVIFLTDRKNPRKQAANIAYALAEDLREKGQFEKALPFYNRYLDLEPDGDKAGEVKNRVEEMQKFISAVIGTMLTGDNQTASPASVSQATESPNPQAIALEEEDLDTIESISA